MHTVKYIAAKINFNERGLTISYPVFHTMHGENRYLFSKGAYKESFQQINFTERGLVTHFLIVQCCRL